MSLLFASLAVGLILALLALGVYISFRIFNFPDITAEGSFPLGAAVAATLLVLGAPPLWATLAGFAAGAAAGFLTGVLHTRFRIHGLLAGILVMTALYSINLHVMGRSNVPLLSETTVVTQLEHLARRLGAPESLSLLGWPVGARDVAVLAGMAALTAAVTALAYAFFRTDLGTAMRATGNSPTMVRALGGHTEALITLGLAVSNGLIGLSGALMAQYQGFADVQMGIGMVVWGLASVILGESLVRASTLGLALIGAVMGSVLFREMVALALRWGLDPNDLKLMTAVFVFAALVAPGLAGAWRRRWRRA